MKRNGIKTSPMPGPIKCDYAAKNQNVARGIFSTLSSELNFGLVGPALHPLVSARRAHVRNWGCYKTLDKSPNVPEYTTSIGPRIDAGPRVQSMQTISPTASKTINTASPVFNTVSASPPDIQMGSLAKQDVHVFTPLAGGLTWVLLLMFLAKSKIRDQCGPAQVFMICIQHCI